VGNGAGESGKVAVMEELVWICVGGTGVASTVGTA
jgi:hypothetical protein